MSRLLNILLVLFPAFAGDLARGFLLITVLDANSHRPIISILEILPIRLHFKPKFFLSVR